MIDALPEQQQPQQNTHPPHRRQRPEPTEYEATVAKAKADDAVKRVLDPEADAARAAADDVVSAVVETACGNSEDSTKILNLLLGKATQPLPTLDGDREAFVRGVIEQTSLHEKLVNTFKGAGKNEYSQLAGSYKRVLMIHPMNEIAAPEREVRCWWCVFFLTRIFSSFCWQNTNSSV